MQITCETALGLLYEKPHDADLAARLFVCMNWLSGRKDKRLALRIEGTVLAHMATEWSRRDIAAIAKRAADMQGKSGLNFATWIKKYRKRGRLRLFG